MVINCDRWASFKLGKDISYAEQPPVVVFMEWRNGESLVSQSTKTVECSIDDLSCGYSMLLFESIPASGSTLSWLGLGFASSGSSAKIPWCPRPWLESHEPIHTCVGYL